LLSPLLSPAGPLTSALQPSNAPLVLAYATPLDAVDEQRARVCSQLVQLGLERVGVLLDKTCQRIPILLGRGPSVAHFMPPDVAARLCLVHAPKELPHAHGENPINPRTNRPGAQRSEHRKRCASNLTPAPNGARIALTPLADATF
jgi:hypothetical protein